MNKIIRINEKELTNIISEAVEKVLNLVEYAEKDISFGNLKIDGESVDDMKLIVLESNDDREQWEEPVWNMLVDSYEKSGGLKSYFSFNDFKRKKHNLVIVISNVGELLACASYRKIDGSLKMTAIGAQQNEMGKIAIQEIVKHNIAEIDLHYWAEVSGAIEHYFKKHNGYPMPNTMASQILSIPENELELLSDNVHYKRAIGLDEDMYPKMIFGIKSPEIFDEVTKIVDNYEGFMKEVNKIVNEDSNQQYSLKQIVYIIENIYRCHEEDGFNELIPSWYKALNECLSILKQMDQSNELVKQYIEYGEYLLDVMPPLTLNKLNI